MSKPTADRENTWRVGKVRPWGPKPRKRAAGYGCGSRESENRSRTSGWKCLYEWRGEEPALIEFTRWPPLGWRMTEAKGPKNAEVSARTRAEILAALSACPDFAPVWPTDEAELLEGL